MRFFCFSGLSADCCPATKLLVILYTYLRISHSNAMECMPRSQQDSRMVLGELEDTIKDGDKPMT